MAPNENKPVETVESLQAQLESERSEHDLTKQALEEEQQAHESTKAERDAALEHKANAEADVAQASEIIEGQSKTIADQEKRIIELQTSPSAFPSFKLGKDQYEVQAKTFKFQGVEYTDKQLLVDKDLQKELVKKGMGFLVLVKKEA